MSQIGSNAAGEVFADFRLNTTPAEQGIDRIGQKAVETGNKLEKDVGQKGGQGLQQISAKALGAAAALGAVLASVERVMKAIDDANKASGAWADTFRNIDAGLSPIVSQLGDQGELFDRLREQAAEFGKERINALEAERNALDAASVAYRGILNVFFGTDSNAVINNQIQQIEARRKQLQEAIRQAEVDTGIARLEREAENIRREKLTADERRVEDLQAKIADAQRLAEKTAEGFQQDALKGLVRTFEQEITAIMAKAGETAGEAFAETVKKELGGFFDATGISSAGISIQSQLQAIESQLRSVGTLGGGV
jgi:DNA repair exonuclease SbcCD ATPase subunit